MTEAINDVLRTLVDGSVITAAYVLKQDEIISYWPNEALDKESKEIILDAIYVRNRILIVYDEEIDWVYILIPFDKSILILRVSKDIISSCGHLDYLLTTLNRFSRRVRDILYSTKVQQK